VHWGSTADWPVDWHWHRFRIFARELMLDTML